MANPIIAPSTLLQAQSAYNNVSTQKNDLPDINTAESFQTMVRQNFNSFSHMKPEQVLAYIKQVKSGTMNSSRDALTGAVQSLANKVQKDEDVKKRSGINEASLSEVIAATSEAGASLKTAIAVRNKVLKAFEDIMNMQL